MMVSDFLYEEVEQLKTLRDELRVQAELGKMEARELFARAEQHWEQLDARLHQIREQTEQPLHEVAEAARTLARDIGEAYRAIKASI